MNKGFEVWFQNSGRKSKRRGTYLEALSLEAQLERFHQQDQTLSVLHLKRKNNVINKIISGEVLHLCIRVRNRDSEPEPDLNQCCGSMTFWGGSGSGFADPCLWLMDQDPAIFFIDLHDASKKLIFQHNFFCFLLFEGTFTSFFEAKSQKEVTKQ